MPKRETPRTTNANSGLRRKGRERDGEIRTFQLQMFVYPVAAAAATHLFPTHSNKIILQSCSQLVNANFRKPVHQCDLFEIEDEVVTYAESSTRPKPPLTSLTNLTPGDMHPDPVPPIWVS